MRAKRVALSPHAQHTHAQHWTQGLGAHGKALKQKLADQGWHLGASTTVNFVQTLSTLLIDEHTLQHMHASPRSNHSDRAPSAHSHTCMHRLTAITVTMCLAQAQTLTPTHACIAQQQKQ